MRRLGTWVGNHQATVSHDDTQALVKGNARIAHVALVYSGLEGQGPEAEAAFIAGAETILFARRYSNFIGLFHEIFQDTQPFWQSLWTKLFKRPPHEDPQQEPRTSLRIRQDEGYPHKKRPTNGSSRQPGPSESLFRELENDVAIYVCHNGRRERIRGFIQDALLRLACRDDVSSIVLNTHSNGTVIGLDVVQELPPFATEKIRAIITAGSPLRKYVDLFSWGKHLAVMPKIKQWWNFWDEKDIVADPLRPWAGWKRGKHPTLEIEQLLPEQLVGIYQALDPVKGKVSRMPIKDIMVDNVTNSPPGGMRAHNYWDNTKEFMPKVVDLLKEVMAAEEANAGDAAVSAGS